MPASSVPRPLPDVSVEIRILEPSDAATLSEDEFARAGRFRSPADRDRFVAGRVWLRRSLGDRLDVEPGSIVFSYGSLGKPTLAWPECDLSFSLSHSQSFGMLAIGSTDLLGADIEPLQRGVYEREAASIVLSPEEIAWVESHDEPDVPFLECWVRKEAYGKAMGFGLNVALASVSFMPGSADRDGDIQLRGIEVPGAVAAVATRPGLELGTLTVLS